MTNRIKTRLTAIVLLLVPLWLVACQSHITTKTLYVGPEQADCTGVIRRKCLLVKENNEDGYSFFYDSIDGFEWERGSNYEIVVEVTEIENPPADASSLRYKLVDIVNKQVVTVYPPLLSILDGRWAFGELNIVDVIVQLPDGNDAYLLIKNKAVSGSAGCNNFSGTAVFERGSVTFSQLAVTRKMCRDSALMAYESTLLALLENATTFTTGHNTLELGNADGTTILQLTRVQE